MSTATVSRVMTGRGPVGEATRQRVLQVAQRLRYQPSAPARGLRSARSLLMGAVVPDLSNPVFVPFLRGVQHVAGEHDYAVLVVDAQRSPSIEHSALDRLLAQGVDALVLAGSTRDWSRVDELRRSGVVVVEPGRISVQLRPHDGRPRAPGDPGDVRCARRAGPPPDRLPDPAAAVGGGGWPPVGGDRPALAGARPTPEHIASECVAERRRRVARRSAPLGRARRRRSVRHPWACPPRVERAAMPAWACADCPLVVFGDSDWAAAYRPALSVVALDLFAGVPRSPARPSPSSTGAPRPGRRRLPRSSVPGGARAPRRPFPPMMGLHRRPYSPAPDVRLRGEQVSSEPTGSRAARIVAAMTATRGWRATVWNARIPDRFPDVIVQVETVGDVVAAIRFAGRQSLPVGVRSGGHSWAANHLRDGGLLLDVSRLRSVHVDAAVDVRVRRAGHVGSRAVARLETEGLFFPAGHCPGVALGGYLLQGGFGWNGVRSGRRARASSASTR